MWGSFFYFQILFLNKLDLFKDKIRYSGRHLRLFFEEFRGNYLEKIYHINVIYIITMFMQYENYKFCLFGHLFVFHEYLKTIFVAY